MEDEKLRNELEDDEKYPLEGEVVARRVLSAQIKEDDIQQQHGC